MAALAFHLLPGTTGQDWVDWASRGAPWVKVCDAESIARVKANGARCYWRPYLGGDDGGVLDANAWAKRVIDSIHYTGGVWPDACGFRNEMPGNAAQGLNYATYRDRLREAGYTGLVVLGSFSVGTPDWPAWAPMLAAIPGDPPDALELHEYWADHMGDNAPWYELRHVEAIRRGLIHPDTPLFIGECGRDSPPGASPGGWQGVISSGQQAANLAAYLAACAPSVRAAFVFADGTGGQWARYFTRGTALEAAIRQSWQGASPVAPIVGIDVSTFQVDPQDPQPVDWAAVAASGRAFAYCKATEGTGYVDPQFAHNWPGIRAAGLARGCYHYARFDLGNRPEDEAAYFLAHVGTWQPGDYFVLDAEQQTSLGDLSGWVGAWLDAVAARTGAKKVVYSYASFLAAHNLTQASLGADVSLILAAYQAIRPAVPAGWDRYVVWQHADDASVPGVQLATDEDYLEIPLDELRALGVPGGTDVDQQAQQYYFQDGFKVPTGNALWTVALEPLYAYAMQLKAQGSPLADLVMPGPLKSGELPATWGQGRPASVAKLTNREVGVYQDAGGVWRPYQAEIF